LASALDAVVAAAGVSRPLRLESAGGGPVFGVELRTATVNGHRVAYIIGLNAKPVTVRLSSPEPVIGWTDLITRAAGTGDTFTIKPLDVLLLDLG
jgi:hypothetical protein